MLLAFAYALLALGTGDWDQDASFLVPGSSPSCPITRSAEFATPAASGRSRRCAPARASSPARRAGFARTESPAASPCRPAAWCSRPRCSAMSTWRTRAGLARPRSPGRNTGSAYPASSRMCERLTGAEVVDLARLALRDAPGDSPRTISRTSLKSRATSSAPTVICGGRRPASISAICAAKSAATKPWRWRGPMWLNDRTRTVCTPLPR